jgi:sugar phosphate isomerase/epimerase
MRVLTLLAGTALLASTAVTAFAADGGSAKLNYAAMDKLGWKLSSQAYTFRELTLFDTLDTMKKIGFKYVELFPGQRLSKEDPAGFDHNATDAQIAAVKAKLKETGIKAMNYGVVGLDNNEANDRKVFDFAKKMGITTIVAEPPEDSFTLLDKLCQEYKMNVAIHDHPQPSHYWNPDTVLKVTQGTSKRIGSCSDTGHWYRSGLVPLDCLKKLKGRIISLHFKDLDESKGDVPWGTGVCNAMGMLEELKRQGFRGVFSIEYERTSGQELVDNVTKCVAWFSASAAKLAPKY